MIKLEKLGQEDFLIFKSWINNEDELLQFAGSIFTFPITDLQLINYINDVRRISYKVILINSNEMIGHCELNFENEQSRLSRILIGKKELRNKGYGKLIVNEMLDLLFIKMGYESADLNVFDSNKGAIKCYEDVGFVINEGMETKYFLEDKVWAAKNMKLTKAAWKKNSFLY